MGVSWCEFTKETNPASTHIYIYAVGIYIYYLSMCAVCLTEYLIVIALKVGLCVVVKNCIYTLSSSIIATYIKCTCNAHLHTSCVRLDWRRRVPSGDANLHAQWHKRIASKKTRHIHCKPHLNRAGCIFYHRNVLCHLYVCVCICVCYCVYMWYIFVWMPRPRLLLMVIAW